MDRVPRTGSRRPAPAPADLGATPREHLAELASHIGETEAAQCCADLLARADLHDYHDVLLYLGGRPAPAVIEGRERKGWARVWGARGLLYVWDDGATAVVVQGLGDTSWRAAENCLKVATLREIGAAGPGAVALAGHRLPRVRAQAIRTLGAVGDTEHVEVVDAARDDVDPMVRKAAALAHTLLVERLDLPPT